MPTEVNADSNKIYVFSAPGKLTVPPSLPGKGVIVFLAPNYDENGHEQYYTVAIEGKDSVSVHSSMDEKGQSITYKAIHLTENGETSIAPPVTSRPKGSGTQMETSTFAVGTSYKVTRTSVLENRVEVEATEVTQWSTGFPAKMTTSKIENGMVTQVTTVHSDNSVTVTTVSGSGSGSDTGSISSH
ncbi:MAG: hypothetical protein VKL42_12555 [Snowella sp.]|nr:hypothetical protein [Snowella sp.]